MTPSDLGSWTRVDLTDLLAGDIHPIAATLCPREDGVCLFYPGRSHSISGEPESGKTWLALFATKHELAVDAVVVFIDFEDSADSVVERLVGMGVMLPQLSEQFVYIAPDSALEGDAIEAFYEFVSDLNPSLVIIDGVTEAMAGQGWLIVDNNHAADFDRLLIKPLTRIGAAVVCLDHVPKRKQSQGRNALGAGHKLAAISGAAYMVENIEPFGRGGSGRSSVILAKDRPGGVRGHTQGHRDKQVVAVLQVSNDSDGFTAVTLNAERRAVVQSTQVDNKKAQILTAMGTTKFATKSKIKDLVGGNAQTFARALNELIEEGRVSSSRPYAVV